MFSQFPYKPLPASDDAQREKKRVEVLKNTEQKLQASNGQFEFYTKELNKLQSLKEEIKQLLQCDDKNASETMIKKKYEELKQTHPNEIELLIILDDLRIEYYRQRYTSCSYDLILPEIPAQACKQFAILNTLNELGIKYHWEKHTPSSYLMVLTESNKCTVNSAEIALYRYKKELQKKLEVIKNKIQRKEADIEHWSGQTSGLQSILDKDKDRQVTTEYKRLTG